MIVSTSQKDVVENNTETGKTLQPQKVTTPNELFWVKK